MAASPVRFVRFRPDEAIDVEELRRQRVLCGWGEEKVEFWRDQVRRGVKNLYWVFPSAANEPLPWFGFEPCNFDTARSGPPPPDLSFQPLGHVSLDWEDSDNDESLCDREAGKVTLATFFLLLSQQGKGYGSTVMKEMEEMAKRDLSATSITLNTVDGEFAVQPWWWERQGVPYSPTRRVNEKWYERLGYVAYKRGIPRYPGKTVSGEDILLEAVFMEKKV
ncbi:hypothetical protein Rhopal_005272-T1 [Rhodotorula paludigena]|uniref:N-acetyltransferase domain-containing protein n=1 Tax=Rhodotorula paludigena TaxID=86838 RepID=A0AAV5GT90_9BASI|nr:hypothetical protein Rhopal_005272-T1 [Rhodotorula paludigena]